MVENGNHPVKQIKVQQPLFMVPKKDVILRIVQDFWLSNVKSQDDRHSKKDTNEHIRDCGNTGSIFLPPWIWLSILANAPGGIIKTLDSI